MWAEGWRIRLLCCEKGGKRNSLGTQETARADAGSQRAEPESKVVLELPQMPVLMSIGTSG